MAVGVLRAGEQVVFDDTGCLFLDELGLDGRCAIPTASCRW
jgi:hypothetical protein